MGTESTRDGLVMVNFMYQLGWATVPRYLVKHCSGCFCEGAFV